MTPAIELLCKSLSRRDELQQTEIDILEGLTQKKATFAKGAELISAHSRTNSSCLVTSGLTARAVMLEDGRRQLTALHVPGDFVDLHALLLKVMDHSVLAGTGRFQLALTQSDVADVLGLSVVHTNRTIRDLRATGFVSWKNFDVEIRDFDRLADLAGFDPTYLSLTSEPR